MADKPTTSDTPRRWRIILARDKGVQIYIGTVEAPDAKTAVEVAANELGYPEWQLIAEAME